MEPTQSPDSIAVSEVEALLDKFLKMVHESAVLNEISDDGMVNLLNAYFGRSLSDYYARYDFTEG